MSTGLTQAQLDELESLVSAGDPVDYYKKLADFGDPYGNLAKQVVNNDTPAGAIARAYAETYATGPGLQINWLLLSRRLMEADFLAREAAFNTGQNALDLPVDLASPVSTTSVQI